MKFKVGDKVTWNIKKGVNPEGIVVEEIENYGSVGDTRYKVKSTKTINFTGDYGKNSIKKGEILYPYRLKKIK